MNQNTTAEIWKDIKGYEGHYQVSNHGNVRSCYREGIATNGRLFVVPSILIKKHISNAGYQRITVSKNRKTKHLTIHRLVAESFLDKKEDKNIVDHIDRNKENNHVDNLRWCNQKENIKFFFDTFARKGETAANAKLTDKDVSHIKREMDRLMDIDKKYVEKIAKGYGVSRDAIYKIKVKKYWSHIK